MKTIFLCLFLGLLLTAARPFQSPLVNPEPNSNGMVVMAAGVVMALAALWLRWRRSR